MSVRRIFSIGQHRSETRCFHSPVALLSTGDQHAHAALLNTAHPLGVREIGVQQVREGVCRELPQLAPRFLRGLLRSCGRLFPSAGASACCWRGGGIGCLASVRGSGGSGLRGGLGLPAFPEGLGEIETRCRCCGTGCRVGDRGGAGVRAAAIGNIFVRPAGTGTG
jgi:hypothetical protein